MHFSKSLTLVAIAVLAIASAPAHAALVWQDDQGNTVAAPGTLDPNFEPVYFTETITLDGGYYTVTNNTALVPSYGLLAIGISASDGDAFISSAGNTFGCGASWCYGSSTVFASDWATVELDFSGNTGSDLFGAFSNVLDPGDDRIHLYLADDGDLRSGDSWDEFLFGELPSSQLFVVLDGDAGAIYGSGGQPIPEPGTALLLMSGLAGLGAVRRRR